MKYLIEKIIKLRNPQFAFDKEVGSGMLFEFFVTQFFALVRGCRFLLLFKNPKGAMLGRRVRFFYPWRVQFSNFLKIQNDVYISALGKEGISFGRNVSIGAYSRIIVSTSFNQIGEFIRIGNHVGIGEFAYLGGAGGLEIGDDCIIGQYFSCHPENHIYQDSNKLIRHQGVNRKGIKIGKNCWIGSKVTVLDGVEIGDNCIVAAGSVVTESIPSNSLIAGVPAKIKKSI